MTTAPRQDPPAPLVTPALAPPLGSAVGRGVAWMIFNTGWSRGVSFAAQWALAWLLDPDEYGLYAVALAFAIFVQFFKDGGGRQILIQRGPAEYRALAGSVFWLALLFNLVAAGILAGLAPLVARLFGDPRLVPVLLVIALSLPLSTPASILSAKLWIDLRPGALASVQMGSALIRYGGAVLLAWLGFGPLSWAVPLVGLALFEGAAYFIATRDTAWLGAPNLRSWPALLHTSKWIALLALALATFNQGAYLVLPLLVSLGTVGIFSFAFQIVMQIEMLVAYNLHSVLFPTLVRLNAEPERQRDAVVRSLRTLSLIAAPAGLALAVMIGPLEALLWRGRWAPAVVPVQILAIFMSARVLYAVPDAILQARGRFKRLSLMVFALGSGSMLAAWAGATIGSGTPVAIAAWIGGYLAVACVVFAASALAAVGLSVGRFFGAIAPAWVLAAATAGITYAVDAAFVHHWPLVPRLIALGGLFSLLFAPAARAFLPGHVEEAVRILPGAARAPIARLMRLRPA